MKDFYMVIYLVKQLMPGDEEALKQHLIKDYVLKFFLHIKQHLIFS